MSYLNVGKTQICYRYAQAHPCVKNGISPRRVSTLYCFHGYKFPNPSPITVLSAELDIGNSIQWSVRSMAKF